MHVTRPPGLPALAIVLPHPPLPRTRSSLASVVSSPRTPRTPSCGSNVLFAAPANRNSTDSWNSSNAADDLEWDWKPEQVRLLSRTLDALPPHLVTPFNGPIPPSNLLDKIARGVSHAKGPIDWPHSIRATRVKLIELSRVRAKEEHALVSEVHSNMETEESNAHHPGSVGKGFSVRRPLYRQSSMDFMNAADLKDKDGIACLSDRLQRTDRPIPKATFHPYSRHAARACHGRLSSPYSADVPSLINPSTPSSSTLNTLSSFSSHNRVLRRTASNLSSTSASSMSMMSSNGGAALPDPRVQRVRRSDSFCAPAPPPKDTKALPSFYKENLKDAPAVAGIKRAPSFGALVQEARRDRLPVFGGALNGNEGEGAKDAYPSSDEEEKIRTKGAKKMKAKDGLAFTAPIATTLSNSPALGSPMNTAPSSPITSPKRSRTKAKVTPTCVDCKPLLFSPSPTPKTKKRSVVSRDILAEAEAKEAADVINSKGAKKTRPTAMNLQRNPSMFGAELPRQAASSAPEPPRSRAPTSPAQLGRLSSPTKTSGTIPGTPTAPPSTPQKVKTLRRVRRLAPARRISFGSLAAPGEEADAEAEEEEWSIRRERQRQRDLGQLGSAFQLH